MTKINWSGDLDRYYETGISKGVLYPKTGPGVAWPGLVSIDETLDGGEVSPYYYDGYTYLNLISNSEYRATISTIAFPVDFEFLIGNKSVAPGLIATNQKRQFFDFSYRTEIGSLSEELGTHYKIHLVYNLLALRKSFTYSTFSSSTPNLSQSIEVYTIPPLSTAYSPTAHLIIDSKAGISPEALSDIEDILYGTDAANARMPSPSELLGLL